MGRIYLILLPILLAASHAMSADAPSPKIQKDYEALVAQADLASHPERHTMLATWCRGMRWTEQADFHEQKAARHQYTQEHGKLKGTPVAADWKRLLDLATRLKLEDEQADARAKWVATEFGERRAKLKDTDLAGLKSLLAWADQQNAGALAEPLAKQVIAGDPSDALANQVLGRVKDGEQWVDPWELLVKRGGLKNVKARYEVHKQVAALRKERPAAYPAKPMDGMEIVRKPNSGAYWIDKIRKGDGRGRQYVFAPKSYEPSKPWPLIVDLHGGGSGDSAEMAYHSMSWHCNSYANEPHVVIVPIARTHVINSWNVKENMLDVIDGIMQTCERFHIDKKRIYLTGGSMGAQGTSRFSWVVPELFAAFCPCAGAYWNDHPVPDLSGKAFLVLHGAKDEGFRNESLKVFLEKIRKANAEVEYVNLPNAGHLLPKEDVYPPMFAFFKKRANEFAPDLHLVRRLIVETVTEKPHGQK